MNTALIEALHLMSKGRLKLLESYTERNSDRYRYSFQYYSSPSVLEISSCLLEHQWIDTQLEIGREEYQEGRITESSYCLFIKTIQRFSALNSPNLFFEEYSTILETKIIELQKLLQANGEISKRFKAIEFDYFRDKILFEREMEKYSQETQDHV